MSRDDFGKIISRALEIIFVKIGLYSTERRVSERDKKRLKKKAKNSGTFMEGKPYGDVSGNEGIYGRFDTCINDREHKYMWTRYTLIYERITFVLLKTG